MPDEVLAPGLAAAAALAALFLVVRLLRRRFPRTFAARVIYVYDGDTVCVRHWGCRRRIRLLGIDAPESEQEFGQDSQRGLAKLVLNKRVQVEAVGVDIYGRLLARITVGKKDPGLELLEAGLAWPYFRFFGNLQLSDRRRYRDAYQRARAGRRGLWREDKPQAPWLWRREHRSLWERFCVLLRRLVHRLIFSNH